MKMDSSVFLEDRLQKLASSSASSKSSPPPAPSAHQIAHAWAQLRTCVQNGRLESEHLAALMFLKECGRTLHVAEAQARLLVSILSSVTSADADALGHARSSAAMLLSAWIRKVYKVSGGNRSSRAPPKRSNGILSSVLDSILKALENCGDKHAFIGEAILLLGTLCVPLQIEVESLRICQEALTRECVQQKQAIVKGRLEEALAGVGYAILSSRGEKLTALVRAVLRLWSREQVPSQEDLALNSPSLEDGLMLLHLMEWCGLNFISQPQLAGIAIARVIVEELLEASVHNKTSPVRCATVLSAAGLLRSLYRSSSHDRKLAETELTWLSIMQSLESVVAGMVDSTLLSQIKLVSDKLETSSFVDALHRENGLHQCCLPSVPAEDMHWLLCVGLALSYCSEFPPSPSVLLCLTITLLEGALPLSGFYREGIICNDLDQKFGEQASVLQYVPGNTFSAVPKPPSVHVQGILFREAGTISGVFCEQYRSADKRWQVWIDDLLCQFSHSLYQSHRHFLAVSQSSSHNSLKPVSFISDIEKEALGKIHEAVFLSVFLFFSLATKEKTQAELHSKGYFAVQVLNSLSCVEFIRKGRVQGYSDLVQMCVAWVSASQAACAALIYMFPSYDDVLLPPGPGLANYSWTTDAVQDARVLFCFRVLPSCLNGFPASNFLNRIAPLVLLYLRHPNSSLVQASHSVFAAFIRYDGDSQLPQEILGSQEKGRDTIKEEFAVSYMERILEKFPGVSHFPFLVMGVGAIVRHLPAGSAATVYCMSCLVDKANGLFRGACNKGQHGEDSSVEAAKADPILDDEVETAKKLQTLLFHLILAVDIQVLPYFLQEVARLILGLPDHHRTAALEEAFAILAGSNDLTRKHIIVPWLQSLSYLCSKPDNKGESQNSRSSRVRERGLKHDDASNGNEVAEGVSVLRMSPSSTWEEMRHMHGSFLSERDNEFSFLPLVSRSRL